ncbi:5-oxoprolinase subunit PxpB [Chitinibacter tainanensis]|uniref:5-oxoprolinase subunit PxpB n=1 Tax=Chitinibacter tainanensis TaxID=230667 RepID=UPI0023558529|nr:5-oxoprolinase subunit PxpB [Chitinibacter tainanensis]
MSSPMIHPLGEAALVLDAGVSAQTRLLAMGYLAERKSNRLFQLIPGVGNITMRFNPLQLASSEALVLLQSLWAQAETVSLPPPRQFEIPVVYGGAAGPDLALVAEHCQLSEAAVIEAHASPWYDVLCIGFLPGFPYLAGLPTALHTPRRSVPRHQVATGAVGIGGAQTGIYPCPSPGGWQLIGQTSVNLFDPTRAEPCLLRAGDQLRFVPQEA